MPPGCFLGASWCPLKRIEAIEAIQTIEAIPAIEAIEAIETIEAIEAIEAIETIEASKPSKPWKHRMLDKKLFGGSCRGNTANATTKKVPGIPPGRY